MNHEYMETETLILKNTLSEVATLPPLVARLTERFSLDGETAGSLNLALEEALVNVISYAYPEGTEGQIRLAVSFQPATSALQFELSDHGKPFDPTTVPPVDTELPLDDRPIGGLGIFLIRNIMDKVEYAYRDGCNVLILTKEIKKHKE